MLQNTKTKPEWLKIAPPKTDNFSEVKQTIKTLGLHTVCQSAHCPNITECWDSGTATFMVLGDTCTRACRFCAVKTGLTGKEIDPFEPKKLAQAVKKFGLDYIVITAVDRDDLQDQGASHFADCITEIKKLTEGIKIEILSGDFQGKKDLVKKVLDAKPDVFGHNLETVKKLQNKIRDYRANYNQSLSVLKMAKQLDPKMYTKSSLMVGMGETKEQVEKAMYDLREAKVDFLTIGQYLQPSERHITLQEYVTPQTFLEYKKMAEEKGFLYCAAGPFVRSSYKAGEFFTKSVLEKRRT